MPDKYNKLGIYQTILTMGADAFNITIHMVSSLDGMIAKKDNSVSWFETTDVYEQGVTGEDPTAFLARIDCYVMGARTYEHALALSRNYGWAYGDTPVIVVSHKALAVERPNIEFFSGDLGELVDQRLKPRYRNIWVAGGPVLAKDFIRARLADEIRLSILPIILGDGIPFFDHIGQEHALHLKDVTAYKNGMVELRYAIAR